MTDARERAIRMHIRNFLLPMTIREVQVELDLSIARGDAVRTKYVNEFLCELYADFDGCETPDL